MGSLINTGYELGYDVEDFENYTPQTQAQTTTNADAIVNVLFGNTLTEQAQFPLMKLADPHAKIRKINKAGKWGIAIAAILLGIVIAAVVMYYLGIFPKVCTCC